MRSRRPFFTILTLLLFIVTSLLAPLIGPLTHSGVSAQGSGITVYLQPLDTETGEAITDACFTFVGASNEGCDENGDGYIAFADMTPGTYAVTQTRAATGYMSIGDITVTISGNYDEETIPVYLQPDGGGSNGPVAVCGCGNEHISNGQPVDISIVPIDASTGVALPGACFIIGDVSLEGCDENGDGQVTFHDIPTGTYPVTQTAAPRGYDIEADQWIVVSQNGPIPFFQGSSSNQTGTTSDGLVDVALVTRDPADGDLLTGTCYVIVNASIEGCDENGDGQVDFADVTPGEYTVTQTTTPRGYPVPDDFKILITRDPNQSFIIKQAEHQNDNRHRNVSIVLIDEDTGDRITGKNACVQIVDASNVGCDENGDGQVDFLDIPVGRQDVVITKMPNGYEGEFASYRLDVDRDHAYSIVTVYLALTRN